tara:strand:+ start:153 stop:791 length:639 start_codon:yes stop_codon:yes gene_type:complete
MSLKSWSVKRVERFHIKEFIETWHYSKSINGCKSTFHYALFDEKENMKGAMFYGGMAMANQWKKFADKESDVLELRRLCCENETPKNAESYFIAKTIKDLKKNWCGKILVSYADKQYGHTGVIYKASNWKLVEESKGAKMIKWNDKLYHDKSIRTKYKSTKFNPNQLVLFKDDCENQHNRIKPFAKKIISALNNGDAKYVKTKGKYTYIYKL